MIGAILAGGYGKRLKPITNEIPKALVPIADDYTILDRQMHDFRCAGINEVYILSGHFGEKIEEYLTKKYPDFTIHYFKEEKPLGTLYSVRNLLEHRSDSDVMLRNGDTITDVNFKQMISFSNRSNYGMVMFVTRMRSPFGIVEMIGDMVTKFREKPFLQSYINAGIYIFKKSIFDKFFDDYQDRELETTVFPKLANAKQIGAYSEDVFWMGIDSEKDLEVVREAYKNRKDTPWGYLKRLSTDFATEVEDVFVRAGETAHITVKKQSLVRINYGSGKMSPDLKYKEGSTVSLSKSFEIEAREATSAEIIEL